MKNKEEKFLLTKVSSFTGSHEEQLGYFDSKEEGIAWLKENGYFKKENFKDEELWESPDDDDYFVWIYVTLREIKNLGGM